ncbi:alpha beta-hydrolase [Coniophora puteana RWD-64-598 SS2]|uniref:Alpha beta-hydrolase n=1 Tax=Coniophora puteana (strain RWD-64-598) TaxID=741705 RepID=A0A5M3M8Y9_CONPW|nr:alpha beta-hydrolase [Coniophora puteana RWD-64-598 SS2]EIW75396.1 alpha beta-hydrolase [Coniophora puteana RWD-64-598 SS2]
MTSEGEARTCVAPRSVWGLPTSSKRALLIHGMSCSSHGMIHIAEKLAEHGYYVIAPDLPGHGIGSRADTYTWADYDKVMVALYHEATYDLVVGFSWGAVLALRVLDQLPTPYHERSQRTRVVLLDPPTCISEETQNFYYGMFSTVARNPPKPEFYLEKFPRWTKKDAVLQIMANELCDPLLVDHLLHKWDHEEHLASIPSCVEPIFLLGDPEAGGHCGLKELEPYPQYERRVVKGSSHWLPYDAPDEVVETCIAPGKTITAQS